MECLKLSPESIASLRRMSEADLRAFTEKANSSDSEGDLKLRIYASYLVFETFNSDHVLEQAIIWIERWISVSPSDKQTLDEWFAILATLLVLLHYSQQLARRVAQG
jgi:hypothetical protein